MLPHAQIILEVTQACNHACVHCYNYWVQNRAPVHAPGALSREEIRRLVRRIRRATALEHVAISGGEPFLRQDLAGIVSDLVQDGLHLIVISNASFITDERLAHFPPETTFELTLFSTDPRLHDRIAGRTGAFQSVVDAAVAIKERNCGLAIACVIQRLNVDGLENTLELALALGADGIALNRVNLARHTMPIARELVPSMENLKAALATANRVAERFDTEIGISVPVPPCVVDPSPYQRLHFGWCPRGGKDAYYTIGFNGLVRPCNHSSLILGDLRRQSFRAIVTSPKTRSFWAPVPAECQSCTHPLRGSCRGGCPAASDECYGTRKHVDPFVPFALE